MSCKLADAVAAQAKGAVVLYTTTSGTVPTFGYECSGSARWQLENPDEYYSREAVSASTEDALRSVAQVCLSSCQLCQRLLTVWLCRSGTTERTVGQRAQHHDKASAEQHQTSHQPVVAGRHAPCRLPGCWRERASVLTG